MSENILIRKCRSAALKFWRRGISLIVRIRIRLFYANVSIGKNVSFGRMIRVQTSDDGKIFIGNNVKIEDCCLVLAQRGTLTIGDDTYIGHGSHLCAIKSVSIGKKCLIAAYCILRDMKHGTEGSIPIKEQKQDASPVILGDDVWLGAHTVVTAGVTIGQGTVIGANSVVTKDVAPGIIAAGIPAKVMKKRSGEQL